MLKYQVGKKSMTLVRISQNMRFKKILTGSLALILCEGAFGKVVQGRAHCTAVKEEILNMEGNIETVATGGQLLSKLW